MRSGNTERGDAAFKLHSYPESWRRFLWPLALATLAVTLLTAVHSITRGFGQYPTTGVWTALALDLVDGVFYRPLLDANGYGGTRYFPLFFVLHAGLIRLTGSIIGSGYLIEFAGTALMVWGMYRLLKALGVNRFIAAPAAIFTLASSAAQIGVAGIRADILPLALTLAGLAWCAPSDKVASRRLTAAAVCFALAFMAKMTAVMGPAAAVVYLWLHGRRRAAAAVAGGTGAAMLAGLALTHLASEGRALESFLACGSGGGGWKAVFATPMNFALSAAVDPAFLWLFAWAVYSLARDGKPAAMDLPGLFFLFTVPVTIVIMSSPGTDFNHFVDLHAASISVLTLSVLRHSAKRRIARALPIGALVGVGAAVFTNLVMYRVHPQTRAKEQRQVMAAVAESTSTGPLLSDDPWVPIRAGERVFSLDSFTVRTASVSHPEIARDFFGRLERRAFRAVILFVPVSSRVDMHGIEAYWRGRRWFGEIHYPPGFEDRLLENYQLVRMVGDYIVLLPRSAGS